MSIQILESGVLFGDFDADSLFQIEQSEAVKKLGDGISKVEFIYRAENEHNVIFLEAKSSYPRDAVAFFEEIKQKMLHSLIIWFTSVSGRHLNIKEELGQNLNKIKLLRKPIQLLLVIPKMPDDACVQASHKFRKSWDVERRLWNIKDIDIVVLNTERARKKGLVSVHQHNIISH